jgi:hypothetical protein
LNQDGLALPDQYPAWLDCTIADNGGQDASRLYELPDGQKILLPLVRYPSSIPGLWRVSSMPAGWGIGGTISSRPLRAEDAVMILADMRKADAAEVSIRPNPMTGDVWAEAQPAGVTAFPRLAHVLDLEGGFQQVWAKRFKAETRTAVRKAEKAGVEVESGTSPQLVKTYYELFERSLIRWGAQQHEPIFLARWRGHRRDPYKRYQLMAEKLGGLCRFWVASYHGQPAAGILVLYGQNAHYTRGAMDRDVANPTRANDLIQRLAIEEACRLGCRYYHMGETGGSASLARYKLSFGARPYSYAEYFLGRIPITRINKFLRNIVKRAIGFQDA